MKCFKFMLMKFFPLQERSLFSIHDPTSVNNNVCDKHFSSQNLNDESMTDVLFIWM